MKMLCDNIVSKHRGWVSGYLVGEVGCMGDRFERLGDWGTSWRSLMSRGLVGEVG